MTEKTIEEKKAELEKMAIELYEKIANARLNAMRPRRTTYTLAKRVHAELTTQEANAFDDAYRASEEWQAVLDANIGMVAAQSACCDTMEQHRQILKAASVVALKAEDAAAAFTLEWLKSHDLA